MSDVEGLDPVETASRCPDVYVCYEDTPREAGKVVGRYDGSNMPPGEFRFIADLDPLAGDWGWTAIAIFELPNLFKLTDVANRILLKPVDPDASKATTFGTAVLRRTKHYPYFGFARVQTTRGDALNALRQIDELNGYAGSALVSGTYSILVELGGETPDALSQAFSDLGAISGTSHEGGQVVGTYYYRPPDEDEGRFFEVGEAAP